MGLPSTRIDKVVEALKGMEQELEELRAKAEEGRRALLAFTYEEIERAKAAALEEANKRAQEMVEEAKRRSEAEAAKLAQEAEAKLKGLRERIERNFERAVEEALNLLLKG